MILGLSSFTPLTWIHTILSLVALVAGIAVAAGLVKGRVLPGWSGLYLSTAVATSVTGFFFPFERFLPSHWIGLICLVLLGLALVARYGFRLGGAFGPLYAAATMATVYFLVFVTLFQAFLKVAPLAALAPTQSETPFAAAQIAALALFVVLTVLAVRAFRPGAVVAAHP